jgi:hypothetical protein
MKHNDRPLPPITNDARVILRLLRAADRNGISEASLANALDMSSARVANAVTELANLRDGVYQTRSLRWIAEA